MVILCGLHLSAAASENEKKSPKKLQIGVKKRVENCEQKSRRGDLLSMHYTVKKITISQLHEFKCGRVSPYCSLLSILVLIVIDNE